MEAVVNIMSFKHFKAFGMDGIYPAMQREGIDHLKRLLGNIFQASPVLGNKSIQIQRTLDIST